MEWTIATRGRCFPKGMLASLLWGGEGVAFLQHRQAKATVGQLCVEGDGQINEMHV